jgi:hypothetical protein
MHHIPVNKGEYIEVEYRFSWFKQLTKIFWLYDQKIIFQEEQVA